MSETDTPKAARNTPGPMSLWIGVWEGDVFTVKAKLPAAASKKAIRETLKRLGPGDYDTITGRLGTMGYEEKTVDSFVV
jgi:hypothetical protein